MVIIMEPIIPSIVIGLGGTGTKVVQYFKKRINERYGGELDIIKYFAMDTRDVPETFPYGTKLEQDEYMQLYVPNPTDIISGIFSGQHTRGLENICKWFPTEIRLDLRDTLARIGTDGAGQTRILGRFFYEYNVDRVLNKIRDLYGKIRARENIDKLIRGGEFDVLTDQKPNIFLVASLGGGTGSGSFLNLAYLIKDYVINQRQDANLQAILLLPDVFERYPNINIEDIEANTYAALMELEYYLDNKAYYVEYDKANIKVKANEIPFDKIFLVGTSPERGLIQISDSEVLGMIAEAILLGIGSGILTTQRGIAINTRKHNEVEEWEVDNKKYYNAYCGLGVTSILFPSDLISEIFACKLIEKIVSEFLSPYTGDAINNLIERLIEGKEAKYNENSILREIYNIEQGGFEVSEREIEKINPRNLIDFLEKKMQEKEKAIEELTNPSEEESKKGIITMKHRAEDLLSEFKTEINKEIISAIREEDNLKVGLDFIEALEAAIKDKSNGLKAKLGTLAKEEKSLKNDLNNFTSILDNAIKDLEKKGIFGKREIFGRREKERRYHNVKTNYLLKIRDHLKNIADRNRTEKAIYFYTQGLQLLNNYRKCLERVKSECKNIKDSFNLEYNNKLKRLLSSENTFVDRNIIRSEDELKMLLNKYRENVTFEQELYSLCGLEVSNLNEIDTSGIKDKLITYAKEKSKGLREMSIMNYLNEYAETQYGDFEEEIRILARDAMPYWYFNKGKALYHRTLDKISLIGCYDNYEEVAEEANRYSSTIYTEFTGVHLKDKNRIIAASYAYFSPIYAISTLDRYAESYRNLMQEKLRPLHVDKTLKDLDKLPFK